MREARHKALLRKAISACVAAIEVYNKPVMPHRDETFAMLAVNAWELLLKARLVKEAGNKLQAIQVLVPVTGKDGKPTKRLRVEKNRSGNPKTISLVEAMRRVAALPKQRLEKACAANILSLMEIRDNAVHFLNHDPEMARRTHEAGTACIRNFVAAAGEWFDEDLSEHRFMILPLSFETVTGPAIAVPARRSRQAANLMAYLDRTGDSYPVTPGNRYAASVKVETRIVGARNLDAIAVRLTSGADAPEVRLTDEQVAGTWPYTYHAFTARLRKRLPGLKLNKAFHDAMKPIKQNPRFVFRRRLDPRDPKCTVYKDFFSDAAVDAAVKVLEPLTLI